jgi:DNA replication protein DnaC
MPRSSVAVLEYRHSISSTIIASQMPIANWIEHIGDPTLADATLDRLVHNAHKLDLDGGFMRKIHSSLTNPAKSGR